MKLFFWLASVLLLMALAAPAWGQNASLVLADEVTRSAQADTTFELNVVNRQDCLNDDAFTFSFNANVDDSLTVEVWRGTNCIDQMQRVAEGQVGCQKVAAGFSGTGNQIIVPVRNIVAGSVMATVATCDNGTKGDFTLFFLPVDSNGVIPAGAGTPVWPVEGAPVGEFDMAGPGAPSSIVAGAGEEQIIVEYDAADGTDITAYRLYCDPAAGGAGVDGGAPTGCSSSVLVAGVPPSDEIGTRCGNAAATATEITAENLQNFTQYAVAVAAVDEVGNVGALSPIQCATPKPVTGYYEAYRAAGGTAGGGFCALSRRPSASALALVVIAALGLFARRRIGA